jgi:hypothetical protein
MTYIFDLDGVLCNNTYGKYYNATPYPKRIKKVNKLKKQSNTIIIWTSRGSTTGFNWEAFTIKQLRDWGVQYDELRLGKPQYDIFVDDRAINSKDFFKKRKK